MKYFRVGLVFMVNNGQNMYGFQVKNKIWVILIKLKKNVNGLVIVE